MEVFKNRVSIERIVILLKTFYERKGEIPPDVVRFVKDGISSTNSQYKMFFFKKIARECPEIESIFNSKANKVCIKATEK